MVKLTEAESINMVARDKGDRKEELPKMLHV
jgi:hypothetical protein